MTSILHFGFWDLEKKNRMDVRHDKMKKLANGFFLVFFSWKSGRVKVAKKFRKKKRKNEEAEKKKIKKTSGQFFRVVMVHNHAKFRFSTLKNQSAKVRSC